MDNMYLAHTESTYYTYKNTHTHTGETHTHTHTHRVIQLLYELRRMKRIVRLRKDVKCKFTRRSSMTRFLSDAVLAGFWAGKPSHKLHFSNETIPSNSSSCACCINYKFLFNIEYRQWHKSSFIFAWFSNSMMYIVLLIFAENEIFQDSYPRGEKLFVILFSHEGCKKFFS